MKTSPALLLLVFLSISFTVIAQAPPGINYQAIALDATSNPVANQAVSLKLSILDGSATGAVAYSETHTPITDNSGLFSIVIGNGTVNTGDFNAINWGNGNKWLKTEIDITGGTSYVLMGSSQFMSVPYALYANRSGSPSSGTLEMPDGINNITPIMPDSITGLTVPPGKNFYINYDYVTVDTLSFSNYMLTTGMTVRPFIGAGPGSVVKTRASGFLVDSTVEWKSINISCDPFTVPAGKIFIIISQDQRGSGRVFINGIRINRNISLQILKAGDVLSTEQPCSRNGYNINGYLRNN